MREEIEKARRRGKCIIISDHEVDMYRDLVNITFENTNQKWVEKRERKSTSDKLEVAKGETVERIQALSPVFLKNPFTHVIKPAILAVFSSICSLLSSAFIKLLCDENSNHVVSQKGIFTTNVILCTLLASAFFFLSAVFYISDRIHRKQIFQFLRTRPHSKEEKEYLSLNSFIFTIESLLLNASLLPLALFIENKIISPVEAINFFPNGLDIFYVFLLSLPFSFCFSLFKSLYEVFLLYHFGRQIND